MMNQPNPISSNRQWWRSGFTPLLLGSMTVLTSLFSGCSSAPQTYPTPYGSTFPMTNQQGVPINSGVFAPPAINSSGMPPGTMPPGSLQQGTFPTQAYPNGTMQPSNPSLPPFGAPASSFQPGYPQTGYPPNGYPQTGYMQNGYPQGVPLNTMIPPSQPILFGR
jgi:hypothetical protein